MPVLYAIGAIAGFSLWLHSWAPILVLLATLVILAICAAMEE
jgi:hypothetical protein